MLDFKTTTLNNGLKIITAPLENTKAVSILFMFGVGSRYEDKDKNGLSHFLEHMFFKGTQKRPKTIDISRDLDSVGAHYNAYTSEELTAFFVRISSEHFDLGLDVLTDIILNSKFEPEEIEREKGVIVEEINMYNDIPAAKVELVARELVYGDQPLGRSIAGEREIITKFDRETFLNYKKQYYSANNLIIAVAGDKNDIDWVKKIEEKFQAFPTAHLNQPLVVKENQTAPQTALFNKKTDQSNLILGFRTIPTTDEKRPVLKVLTNLMGQMMSSRLFIEVREKRGLCYSIGAEMIEYKDAGFWAVSSAVDNNKVEETVKVILEEIQRLKTERISQEELKRAKENLKGSLYLQLEESFDVADFLAKRMFYFGQAVDPEKVIEQYDVVSEQQVQDLAQKLFVAKNLNLAIVGPFGEKDKFNKILEEF